MVILPGGISFGIRKGVFPDEVPVLLRPVLEQELPCTFQAPTQIPWTSPARPELTLDGSQSQLLSGQAGGGWLGWAGLLCREP